jgi:hypothetical protein
MQEEQVGKYADPNEGPPPFPWDRIGYWLLGSAVGGLIVLTLIIRGSEL